VNLLKLVGKFYSKVFIAVNILSEKIEIQTIVSKGSKEISKDTIKFKTTSLNDEEITSYIKKMELISPFCYISTLDRSPEQGLVPTTSQVEAKTFIDTTFNKMLTIHKSYSLFTSKIHLDRQKKEFEAVGGVDYLFSAVSILENIFSDKLDSSSGAYIFAQESAILLIIIKNGKFLFSDYNQKVDNKDAEESLDGSSDLDDEDDLGFDLDLDDDDDFGIDLEDMEANDIDDMDGLDDLDDLDDIEDLDDLDESSDIIEDFDEAGAEDEFDLDEDSDDDEDHKGSNIDYERFQAINAMVKKFYSDPKYENDFIEHIFVANSSGVGEDLKGYLEDELFVSVIIRSINTLDELNRLAQREVLNESQN